MKWRVRLVPLIALAVLYGIIRNSAFVLAFLTVCGGVAWQQYQEKILASDNDEDEEGNESILHHAVLFIVCCLAAFFSGVAWGVVHGKGWWSILFGVGNLVLFLAAAMVVAYYKVRALT